MARTKNKNIAVEETVQVVTPRDASHGKFTEYEFGGPLGSLGIMIFFPLLFYYLLVCLKANNGNLIFPTHISSLQSWKDWASYIYHGALYYGKPNWTAFFMYAFVILFQLALAFTMPGIYQKGLPLPSLNGKVLIYRCNAYVSLYVYLITLLVLQYFHIIHLEWFVDQYGPLMTVATITGFAIAIYYYITGEGYRMSGNIIYDFFLGSTLNPRIGSVDVKMFAEIRVSWVLLLTLTMGAVAKQYKDYGYVSGNLCLFTYGVWLYTNACAKGENLIPQTWDMYFEKFGWLLSYWNFAGVPFSYCYPAIYMALHDPKEYEFSKPFLIFLFVVLTVAYGIFDASMGQKSAFKAQMSNSMIERRWAFPPIPGGALKNPKFLETKVGSKLLLSGFWGHLRKPNYTSDWVQGLVWGMSAGFNSPIPYFYPVFHLSMLIHRQKRDEAKCAEKYGDDWTEYKRRVPYVFIPHVY